MLRLIFSYDDLWARTVNPTIIIGGHTYVVNTIVEENEYLEIDSRKRTVIRTLVDGTKVNEFNNRGQRIFERIPPGSRRGELVRGIWFRYYTLLRKE